jgi:RNA polymerase sigma factor (TIGR02999 family)
MRLGVGRDKDWRSRSRFLRAAAESMRRILIDHARDRGRLRRAGSRTRLPLTVVDLATAYDCDEFMALEEALRSLEERDPRGAEAIKLRFFAGLSFEEIAETLGTSVRTAKRDWTVARAWLHARLGRARDET